MQKPTPKANAKAEPYTPKVHVTKGEDGETVVVIDDGTGEDLEPVSETESGDEDDPDEEEEEEDRVEEEAFEDEEDDVNLPESTFAASVAETVANVVGASTQQSEEIKVTEW